MQTRTFAGKKEGYFSASLKLKFVIEYMLKTLYKSEELYTTPSFRMFIK